MHRRIPLICLLAAVLLLYLNFQSISLDDFDSGSFALALDHFDIGLQQPHPPGFPVYVAVGRVVRAAVGDRRVALTLLSALSGVIAVGLMAWLGAAFGSVPAGLVAALWLAVLPVFWLTSDIALSDIPGVMLILAAVACLWQARRKDRIGVVWLAAGAAVSGLCLGLRPQNALPLVIFGFYAIFAPSRSVRSIAARIGVALLAGLIAVLVWFLPTITASGGLTRYLSLLGSHSAHVIEIDSLLGQPISGAALGTRLTAMANGIMALVGGDWRLLAIVGLVILVGVVRARWRTTIPRLLILWAAIAFIQVFLVESLERPRLYLPFVPPLLLLAALGWMRERQIVLRAIPAALVVVFLLTTFPLALGLSQQESPPAQAADYIATHYPADKTEVVVDGSFRATQLRLPATMPQLYLGQFNAYLWARSVEEHQPTTLVLLDRDDIWQAAYDAVTQGGDYVPIDDRIFSRDPRIFPQHSLVRMQTLVPFRLLSPDQLVLPASGQIRGGDEIDGRFFGEGWYRAEDVGGVSARWAGQVAQLRIALPAQQFHMMVNATPYLGGQSVTVLVNDREIGTQPLGGTWQPLTFTIPPSAIQGYIVSTITFRHARADTPPNATRTLAAAYSTITFAP